MSQRIHGIYEYLAGVVLIAAPYALGFDHHAAERVSLVAGIVLLVMAIASNFPTSLLAAIPAGGHIFLDFAVPAVLIGAPYLFGFRHELAPTALFITIGVLQLVLTFAMSTYPADGYVVGSLAEGTSTHIERGDHTSADVEV
jgi:hypothetical protein